MNTIKVTLLGRIPRTEWDKALTAEGAHTMDINESARGRIKHILPSSILDIDRVFISNADGFAAAQELSSPLPTFLSDRHFANMTECCLIHLYSGIIIVNKTKTQIERLINDAKIE